MSQAKKGDRVRVHYTGKLTDGTQFDSSAGRDPLEFILGSGMVIAGFDDAITGMELGGKTTVTIPAEKAYGPRHEEMIVKVSRTELPADLQFSVGQRFALPQPDGRQAMLKVADINDAEVTFDGNHELAGKDLVFDIELVEIV